jgi:hypothetical protein
VPHTPTAKPNGMSHANSGIGMTVANSTMQMQRSE